MYAALRVCSSMDPCDWQASELPHLLDELCAMAASVQASASAGGEGVKLSRAEAKLAWLASGGDTERAVTRLLGDRQMKVGATTTPFFFCGFKAFQNHRSDLSQSDENGRRLNEGVCADR